MGTMIKTIAATLILSLASCGDPTTETLTQAPSKTQTARALFDGAIAAYQEGNNEAGVKDLKTSLTLRPNHPRTLSVLAQLQTLAGDTEGALATLTALADLKMAYAILENENYAGLKENERFQALAARFETNANPVISSTRRATLPEAIPLIESVALDTDTGDLFLGSVIERRILRRSAGQSLEEFVAPGAHGLWSVNGMKIDQAARTLWVASAATKMTDGLDEGELGASGAFAFDLDSGDLIGKWILQDDQDHWFGDLLITENGNLFVTDSITPAVYLLNVEADTLVPFLESPHFASLQGLDISRDGRTLFLADYAAGLFAVDLQSKNLRRLEPQAGVVPYGIDGLYRHGDNLIAIQNGTSPQRVVRISVDLKAGTLPTLEVLEQNHPDHFEPTLGQIVGDELIYVANSGWPLFGGKAAPNPEEIPLTTILELPTMK